MPLPRSIARFNKRWTNRFLEPVARRSSGFAVVHHRGRRSGADYATPVNAFTNDDSLIVALTYGPSADWVRNVLAGEAELEIRTVKRPIVAAAVVGRTEAASALPVFPRLATRILGVEDFLQLQLHRPD